MDIIICLCIGYLFGNFSTAYIIGKANHIDIREYGSGNAGTTNALRTLGWKAGFLTFAGDIVKAVLPILLVRYCFGFLHMENQLLTLYTGLGVVLGHNFPFWLHFKGGKGIAATAGVILAFDWRMALIALTAFIIAEVLTRYVSVGSLLVSIAFPVGIIIFYQENPKFIHMLVISLIFTVSAFVKHKANIKRLLNGTENKLGQKSKEKEKTK